MPPHLEKTINSAYRENGNFEQIVNLLKAELELYKPGAVNEKLFATINQAQHQPEEAADKKEKPATTMETKDAMRHNAGN